MARPLPEVRWRVSPRKRRKVPSWRVERFDDGGKFVHGARCAGGCDYGCRGGRFVETKADVAAVSPREELLAAAREIVIYSAGIPMEKATTEERIRAEDVAKALPHLDCVRAIVDAEVRALRRERRALRAALMRLRDVAVAVSENADCEREGPGTCADLDGDTFRMCDPCWLRDAVSRASGALAPKARRRKA